MSSNKTVREGLVSQMPQLRRVVGRIAKNQGVVDDLVQDCCTRIIEKEDMWNGNQNTLKKNLRNHPQ